MRGVSGGPAGTTRQQANTIGLFRIAMSALIHLAVSRNALAELSRRHPLPGSATHEATDTFSRTRTQLCIYQNGAMYLTGI